MLILIYGASSAGIRVGRLLEGSGSTIKGYIDKRAKEIEFFNGKRVYTIDEAEKLFKYKENVIIIICIRNVFEHIYIAKDLLVLGFTNLIYKHKDVLSGKKNSYLLSIDDAYEKLVNEGRVPNNSVFKTDANNLQVIKDFAIIEDDDKKGEKVVFIPKQLLFVDTKNGIAWQNLNIPTTFPGVFLYEYFERKNNFTFKEIYDFYINQFSKGIVKDIGITANDSWGNVTIQGRQEVYNEMNIKFAIDTSFFIRNCPKGIFDSKESRVKVISSGKNRISFLVAKGINFIPIRLSKEDYGIYVNSEEANKLVNYLEDNHIKKINTVIEHPFFYDYPSVAGSFLDLCIVPIIRFWAMEIYREIGRFAFSGYLICDLLEDDGLMYRYLKRMKFEIDRPDEVVSELEMKLNDLLYISNNYVGNQNFDSKYYAVCIDSNVLKKFLFKLENTLKYCLLCTWEKEDDMLLHEYGFTAIKLIFHTVWSGKEVKGVLYERR